MRRLALAFALLLAGCFPLPAAAAAAPAFKRDTTPLPSGVSGTDTGAAAAQTATGSGGAALRMLLGLAIVIAIIFVIYKLLKRSAAKNDGSVRAHGEMAVVASTPLAQSRALHLVRVGDELVLVGSSEQGVTRIRVYGPEAVRKLGLDPRDEFTPLSSPGAPGDRLGFGTAFLESLKKKTAR